MKIEELAYEIMFGMDGDVDKAVVLIRKFMDEQNRKPIYVELPFQSENFMFAWRKWLQYRTDIKKPYKSKLSIEEALKELGAVSESTAIKMIEKSISSGWQGLFEIKESASEKKKDFNDTNYTLEK